MAISSSGFYGLSLIKCLANTAAIDLSAETNKVAMVTDSYTPDFNAHDFYADLTNEVSGTGYTVGGKAITTTTLGVSGGVLTYDADDVSWTTSTITSAMAGVIYADAVGDELIYLMDFVTAASTSAGTFTIQINASGIFTIDFVP